jgi:hypothetical protein
LIPIGASQATFEASAIDNLFADGEQLVELLATSATFASSTVALRIIDDEIAALTLAGSHNQVSENGGVVDFTVSRNTRPYQELDVFVVTSNSKLSAPEKLTIPIGETSATFSATGIDDSLALGDLLVKVSTSAAGLANSDSDVLLVDDEVASLSFNLSSTSMDEKAGTLVVSVTRNTSFGTPLTILLSSSAPERLILPTSVVIPSGDTAVNFNVSAVDNTQAYGDFQVSLMASVADHLPAAIELTIEDDDIPSLVFSFNGNSISEDGGFTEVTVGRNTPTDDVLIVPLTNSEPSKLQAPASVTILSGQTSASFLLEAIDDEVVSGDVEIQLLTDVASHANASAKLLVIEDDVPKFDLRLSSAVITENGGKTELSIQRNAFLDRALDVQLQTSIEGRISSPTSISIPAGQAFLTIQLAAVDNSFPGDDEVISFTVSAEEFESMAIDLAVTNDDPWTWTNPRNPLDTNDDGFVSPIDVLIVINYLNGFGSRSLVPPRSKPESFIDVNSDSFVSPIDVLLVINSLNGQSAGEGESRFLHHLVEEAPSAGLEQRRLTLVGFQFLLWSDRLKRAGIVGTES